MAFGAEGAIETEVEPTENGFMARCRIKLFDDTCGLYVAATGTAHEITGDGYINATSACENAETSAVGRALAFLGLSGSEIASVEEIDKAEAQRRWQKERANAPRVAGSK